MAVASVDASKPEGKASAIAVARKQSKTAAKLNAFSKVGRTPLSEMKGRSSRIESHISGDHRRCWRDKSERGNR